MDFYYERLTIPINYSSIG